MEQAVIPISSIEPNTGQIPGLPANPRTISDGTLDKLKKSIQAHPGLTEARGLLVVRHDSGFVAIGGNQRLRALREQGAQEAPAIIIPEGTDAATLRAYAVLDNAGFGAWVWEDLLRDWSAEELRAFAIWEPDVTIPPQEAGATSAASDVTLKLFYDTNEQAASIMERLAAAGGEGGMEQGLLRLLRKTPLERAILAG